MQEGEPKNGYREQEAAGGTYAQKKVPELERQRQARIKRLQELERQQIELHKQRIINGTLSRRYNARAYDGLTAIVAFLTAVLLLWSAIGYVGRNAQLNASNKKVASLKETYQELQTDNDNREALLYASVDAKQIYQIATQRLGMSYPEKHQVITYHKTESGYVAQYEDIPQ